ncbi:MAG: hypothetical protein RL113_77 [Pseudomonadota bacterium]
MRYIIISLLVALHFSGCEDKERQAAHDAQVAQEARAQLLAELEARKKLEEQNHSKLNRMGIALEKGVITIDTNKTKTFLNHFGEEMHTKAEALSKDLKESMQQVKEESIEINDQYIHVDLNKTQNALLQWSEKFRSFMEEINEFKEILELNQTTQP